MVAIAPVISEKRCGLIGVIKENIDIAVIVVVAERGTAAHFLRQLCQSDFNRCVGKMVGAVLSARVAK